MCIDGNNCNVYELNVISLPSMPGTVDKEYGIPIDNSTLLLLIDFSLSPATCRT